MTTPARPLGPTPVQQQALDAATARLLATVEAMAPDEWAAPSPLPGWSRAHVVAHLTLNAECFAAVLDALGRDEPATMYASNESRDTDIEELARASADVVRGRLRDACAALGTGVREAGEVVWYAAFRRVPGDPEIAAPLLHPMRHREVEIHHADLDLGHGPADWPEEFTLGLVDTVVVDRADRGPFTIVADDLVGRWSVGHTPGSGPTVHGAAADLAWWLVGRGSGAGLACDAGALPDLGAWRGARRR